MFSSAQNRVMNNPKYLLTIFLLAIICVPVPAASPEPEVKIPVIFDTDIADDIDDMWALAYLLKCPDFDIKLITTASGDTALRAQFVAKTLEIYNRTDIPIGIGKKTESGVHKYHQKSWLEGYDYKKYPGTIIEDGVKAMVDIIMASNKNIKVIAVGPLPNLAAALELEPGIAAKSEVIGMQGSIYVGHQGKGKPVAEWNIRTYIKEAQKVFHSPWPMTITPLDTCSLVMLDGENYQRFLKCTTPEMQAIQESYKAWLERPGHKPEKRFDYNNTSTILYDTVAIHLARSFDYLEMETLGTKIDDKGYCLIDPDAKNINWAVKWKDLDGFEKSLVDAILK